MELRRIVTGHTSDGASTVVEDSVLESFDAAGQRWLKVWATAAPPSFPDGGVEPGLEEYFPPVGGTRVVIVEFPPPSAEDLEVPDPEEMLTEFGKHFVNNLAAVDTERPGMHRSATYDFGLVLEGDVVMELDDGETHLTAGDLVVQNGTMHAWHNRGDRTARMLFVCIGAHLGA